MMVNIGRIFAVVVIERGGTGMEQKLQKWKRWEKQHHKMIVIGAVITFVIAAFAFFALNEKSGTIPESSGKVESSASQSLQDTSQNNDAEESGPSRVYVDIAGAVKKPGVYEVDASARMFEVVDEAGGLTKEADTSLMNLAERVSDGMKIVIPSKGTPASNAPDQYQTPNNTGGGSSSGSCGTSQSTGTDSRNSNLVNINQADVIELQAIRGIGPVTAEAVIAYREEHGLFRTKEDLKKVRGIGDKTYEKLKDQITL